jgi:hypothetical protein
MEQPELSVEPGGMATTTVKISNRGSLVERFRLAVEAVPQQVAQVQPQLLTVFPDDERSAVLTFAVPRGPWPPAGRVPFQVVVHSEMHRDVVDQAIGVLTIGQQVGPTRIPVSPPPMSSQAPPWSPVPAPDASQPRQSRTVVIAGLAALLVVSLIVVLLVALS